MRFQTCQTHGYMSEIHAQTFSFYRQNINSFAAHKETQYLLKSYFIPGQDTQPPHNDECNLSETTMTNHLNGIDVNALQNFSKSVVATPSAGEVRFNVKTNWKHQTRTVATINHFTLGDEKHDRHFEVVADEPPELLGANTAPNPQELLMAALNACLSVGYVANASVMGIKIHSLEIETEGSLDLRGFLGLNDEVNPGYDEVSYTVRISIDADEDKVQELHNIVTKTSVNLANFSKAIRMNSKLESSRL